MSGPRLAIFAGGGTGGHTYPAIAVADELVRRGWRVRFVGGRRGIEGRVVAAAGYEIELLPGRGLQRRLTWANVEAILGAVRAVLAALRIVRTARPAVVVGFGGYASLPCVAAARLRRIPVVVHEQDAAVGLANRLGVRLGARPVVSIPGTDLPGATLTGNPVRAEVAAVVRAPDTDPALVTVVSGSQGARSVNAAAVACYDEWRHRADLRVRLVTGPRYFDECAAAVAAARRVDDALVYEVVAYEERMEDLYRRSALVVCRAGAGTVAELTAVGVPAVLVPLPGAPSDHQTRNGRALESVGAGVLLPDAECSGPRLAAVVSDLLADPGRLVAMAAAARSLGAPRAAERVADVVEEHARAH